MSSTPPRNSDLSARLVCSARSKLSSEGRSALIASATAYSRNSCCSRAVRLRAFSNSACRRARRSTSMSRSARTFCNSPPSPEVRAADSVVCTSSVASSDAGNSCAASISCASTSDFPLVLAICCAETYLLRFVQDFVEHPRDIRNRIHGVLIVDAGWPDDRQRSHDFAAHPGRRADQHEIAHRRQGLIEPDHYPHRFLFGIEIRSQEANDFLFLFQSLQQFLQAVPVVLARYQVGRTVDVYSLRAVIGRQRALFI